MRVLVADDDRDIAGMLALYLRDSGNEVTTVTSGGLDVIRAYERMRPDAVLMDVMMPQFNGITISHAILSKHPMAKLVLMSGKLHAEHPFIAKAGAARFLSKPLRLTEVKSLLEELVNEGQAAT